MRSRRAGQPARRYHALHPRLLVSVTSLLASHGVNRERLAALGGSGAAEGGAQRVSLLRCQTRGELTSKAATVAETRKRLPPGSSSSSLAAAETGPGACNFSLLLRYCVYTRWTIQRGNGSPLQVTSVSDEVGGRASIPDVRTDVPSPSGALRKRVRSAALRSACVASRGRAPASASLGHLCHAGLRGRETQRPAVPAKVAKASQTRVCFSRVSPRVCWAGGRSSSVAVWHVAVVS